ncbi:MAG: hypothetical protein H6733_08760 [Alphaproteobacteria bacterium]|nr:hypothetical protein [Alphaproteobacteria bacterium]
MTTPPDPTPLPLDVRDAPDALPDDVLAGLFAQIAGQTVDRAPGWRDRLRALPSARRQALALAGAWVATTVYVVVVGLRADLRGATLAWQAALAGVLLLLGSLGVLVALRGLHRRPLHDALARSLALVALPAVAVVFPWPGAEGAVPVSVHVACGIGSLMVATMTSLAVLVFDRDDRPPPWRVLAAAGLGGVFGFVALGLHCPAVHPLHLVLGHGLAGVMVGAVLTLVTVLRRAQEG